MNEKHVLVIHPPEDNMGDCALCGKHAELRPYGPDGESICFDCGMEDEETTDAQFDKAFTEIESAVDQVLEQDFDQVLEQDFDQVDFGPGYPKKEWSRWLDQLQQPPVPDSRGMWLRKKTLEQHGLDHGHLFHFGVASTEYLPSYEVYAAFDTHSLDVIWTEGGDPDETVYFSKYDFATLQENFPEEYKAGDLKTLARQVVAEQDIEDEYPGGVEDLLDDPTEFIPFTDTIVEI